MSYIIQLFTLFASGSMKLDSVSYHEDQDLHTQFSDLQKDIERTISHISVPSWFPEKTHEIANMLNKKIDEGLLPPDKKRWKIGSPTTIHTYMYDETTPDTYIWEQVYAGLWHELIHYGDAMNGAIKGKKIIAGVRIIGHASPLPTNYSGWNHQLATDRALAMRQALQEKGIREDFISTWICVHQEIAEWKTDADMAWVSVEILYIEPGQYLSGSASETGKIERTFD